MADPARRHGPLAPVVSIDSGQPLQSLSVEPIRFASSKTSAMVSSFSLVSELVENRDRYSCSEWIAIQSLPSHLTMQIEQIRTAVGLRDPGPKPGANAVIAAAIHRGVDILTHHEDVLGTLEVRDQLTSPGLRMDREWARELFQFIKNFPLSSPDAAGSGTRRVNLTVPNYVKVELGEVAGELGVSASALTVQCLALVFQYESCLMREDRAELAAGVERFLKRIEIRRTVAEDWLKCIRSMGGPQR